MMSNKYAYESLAYAVIMQAVEDWRWLCNGGTPTADCNFDELTHFFKEDFKFYTRKESKAGEMILKRLQKEQALSDCAMELLWEVRRQDKAIDKMCDELERIRCQCEKTTTTISDMPKGGGSKEDAYISYIDKQDEINAAIDRLAELREEVQNLIGGIEKKLLRDLMRYRYIEGWDWEHIAIAIGRPVNVTRKNLHARALRYYKAQYIKNA